ncbi:MAG: flagellar basal-body rod protein FlgG [Rickettsiales bacterium]|nr:flagellar basal-body rod protein FlgG [Rickettsiales bacterium]
MRSLNIAATGIQAQQTHVDVISHNLANMTTTGYKRQRAEFQDLIYENQRRVGTNSSDVGTIVPTGTQFGLGVKTAGVYRNHNQGTVAQTENALDVAMQGRGFFQVELPTGEFAYTRSGAMQRNQDGEIVTIDGYLISPAITIPDDATSISINATGEVEVTIDGQIEPTNLGQFDMATFINPAGLEAIGGNLYKETEASGAPVVGLAGDEGFGSILQGFLEQSNVNPVTEITQLIVAQRAYEMNTKVITASDEMLQQLNQSA